MTVNERVKYFRKDVLRMNQTEFAFSIGMKQTSVSSFEKEGATVSEQCIKAISSIHGVREEWLRDGSEPMYSQPETFSLDDFAAAHHATDLEKEIIKAYFEIDENTRKILLAHFKEKLLGADGAPDTPEELEALHPPIDPGRENENAG